MNTTNFKKVLGHIKASQSCWKQDDWHCGTSHCFGGWAQILSGKPANNATVRRDARVFLELTAHQADYCFAGQRRLVDFEEMLAVPDGYNWAGRDRDGYDRDGYDRDGYDRDGLDKNFKARE